MLGSCMLLLLVFVFCRYVYSHDLHVLIHSLPTRRSSDVRSIFLRRSTQRRQLTPQATPFPVTEKIPSLPSLGPNWSVYKTNCLPAHSPPRVARGPRSLIILDNCAVKGAETNSAEHPPGHEGGTI